MDNEKLSFTNPLLLLSRSTWLHEGLRVLLAPLLEELSIDLAQDMDSAKRWAEEHPHGIWIIDEDTFPVQVLHNEIQEDFPLPCVVITTTFEEYQAVIQHGIEVVLLRGFSIEELTAAIARAVEKDKRIGGLK